MPCPCPMLPLPHCPLLSQRTVTRNSLYLQHHPWVLAAAWLMWKLQGRHELTTQTTTWALTCLKYVCTSVHVGVLRIFMIPLHCNCGLCNCTYTTPLRFQEIRRDGKPRWMRMSLGRLHFQGIRVYQRRVNAPCPLPPSHIHTPKCTPNHCSTFAAFF